METERFYSRQAIGECPTYFNLMHWIEKWGQSLFFALFCECQNTRWLARPSYLVYSPSARLENRNSQFLSFFYGLNCLKCTMLSTSQGKRSWNCCHSVLILEYLSLNSNIPVSTYAFSLSGVKNCCEWKYQDNLCTSVQLSLIDHYAIILVMLSLELFSTISSNSFFQKA